MTFSTAIKSPLISNGYTLDPSPNRLGWLEPTDPAESPEMLDARLAEHGYLCLKGILKRETVLAFRRRYFAALAEAGTLAPGSDPVDGLYRGDEDKAIAHRVRSEAAQWAAYEAFCLMPEIWQFYERLLNGSVYLHNRKLIRHTKPLAETSTPAHYDLTYLRAGTDRVYTSWIPIGDIPVEMGGLIYLEGSHAYGREAEAEFSRKNADLPPEERISAYNRNMAEGGWLSKDLPNLAERLDTRWLMANYEAGDMVVHSPYMIHAATRNESSEGRMRLSTDIRYQLVRDEIDPRWRSRWSSDDGL